MQLPPDAEFWLRVAAIGVPALSAIFVAVVTYRFGRRLAGHQKELNKELAYYQSGLQASLNEKLENHKGVLTMKLDTHRHELQSDFQARLYEFQTRDSLLHQKKVEAIEKLFALLARIQNDLQIWATDVPPQQGPTAERRYLAAQEHFRELINFFDEKRIYFDHDIRENVIDIVETTSALYREQVIIEGANGTSPSLDKELRANAGRLISQNIHPLMDVLEWRFMEILEAETPASSSVYKSVASPAPSNSD